MKNLFLLVFAIGCMCKGSAQNTYCNPINIDYGYTPIPNFSELGRHRATADPVIVNYKNDYYLFSTNQWGYWWSPDMLNWKFISRKFLRPWNKGTYDELCGKKLSIGHRFNIFFRTTNACEFFYMAVPGSYILVPNGPVNTIIISLGCRKIPVTPALATSSPG